MKILAVEWRSAKDTVGFVLMENEIGEQSVRVGKTKPNPDYPFVAPLHDDVRYIAYNGAKLSFKEAQAFFPWIKEENYKKS